MGPGLRYRVSVAFFPGATPSLHVAAGLAAAILELVVASAPEAVSAQGGSTWPPRVNDPPPARPKPGQASAPPAPESDPSSWERPPDHEAPARPTRHFFVLDVFASTAFTRAIDVSDDLIQGDALDLAVRHTFGFGLRPRFFPATALGIGPYARVLARQTLGVAGELDDGRDYRLGAGRWWTIDFGPSAVGQVEAGPVWLFLNVEGGVTVGVVDRTMDGFESDNDLGFHLAASAGTRWWVEAGWSLFAEVGVAYHSVEHLPEFADDGSGPPAVTPRFESLLVTIQVGVGIGARRGRERGD